MTIVIYHPFFTRGKGGMVKIACELANVLYDNGFNVYISTHQNPNILRPSYDLNTNIPVVFGKAKQLKDRNESEFTYKLKKISPDIIIIFAPGPAINMLDQVKDCNSHLIISEHNDPNTIIKGLGSVNSRHKLLRIVDRVHVSLDTFKQELPLDIRMRTYSIPHPVHLPHKKNNNKINKKKKRIINLARIQFTHKQQNILLEAFAKINNQYQDWELCFCGDFLSFPDDVSLLKSNVRQYNLEGKVIFIEHTDKPYNELQKSDIFVFPSKYECFGLSLVEAMANSLPCVGFAECPAVNEIIEHKQTGLLAAGIDNVDSLSNAMEMLMSSEEKRKAYGKAGFLKAKRYNYNRFSKSWITLVNDLYLARKSDIYPRMSKKFVQQHFENLKSATQPIKRNLNNTKNQLVNEYFDAGKFYDSFALLHKYDFDEVSDKYEVCLHKFNQHHIVEEGQMSALKAIEDFEYNTVALHYLRESSIALGEYPLSVPLLSLQTLASIFMKTSDIKKLSRNIIRGRFYIPKRDVDSPFISIEELKNISKNVICVSENINKLYNLAGLNMFGADIILKGYAANNTIIDFYIPREEGILKAISKGVKSLNLIHNKWKFCDMLYECFIKKVNYVYPLGIHSSTATPNPMSNLGISFHTMSKHPCWYHYKESYLPTIFYFDKNGYSGGSYFANNISVEQVNSIHEKDAETTYQYIKNTYIDNNVSKYVQPSKNFEPSEGKKYILVAMQILTDTVARFAYLDSLELVRSVVNAYKGSEYTILIKRHPSDNLSATEKLLNELADRSHVKIVDYDIGSLISHSEVVFTVNSGVGFESLLRLKPVVTSGKSDYSIATSVVRSTSDIKMLLQQKRIGKSKIFIKKFLHYYFNNVVVTLNDSKKLERLISNIDISCQDANQHRFVFRESEKYKAKKYVEIICDGYEKLNYKDKAHIFEEKLSSILS